jgi:hypothetical protein
MRLIFYSLLLISIGYFAWQQWGISWYATIDRPSEMQVQPRLGAGVGALVLLSERSEPLSVNVPPVKAPIPVQPSPVSSAPSSSVLSAQSGLISPPAIPSPGPLPVSSAIPVEDVVTSQVCREFGPFAERDAVDRFRTVLGVGGQVVERSVKKISAHWLVVLPSANGVVVRTAELNSFLVQQGLFMSRSDLPGLQGQSVVGPFVSAQVAQSYQRRLQELNVATRVHSVDDSNQEFWLRSEFQAESLPVVSAAFNGYLSGSQVQNIAQLVCN